MAAIIGQILIGWLIADFASGLFHFVTDRVLSERVPVLGSWLIAPGRLHHREPNAFTSGSFLKRSLASISFVAGVSAIWFGLAGPSVCWAAATLAGLLTTEIHYWAHVPAKAPRLVRCLQQIGILQSPMHHAGHHCRAPGRYCVISNWLNPILDPLEVWGRLERALVAIGVPLSRGAR